MTQQVKALAMKPDHLSLIPETHVVKKKKKLTVGSCFLASRLPCVGTGKQIHAHTNTKIIFSY